MPTKSLATYADQKEAQKGLAPHVGAGKRLTALGQALNAAYDGKGKDSGKHKVDGEDTHVLHASAGKLGADQSVTLFYFFKGTVFHLLALAEHVTNDTYKIDTDLGQDEPPFQKKKTVGPGGK
ncbi:hypothetical protein [Streptomyces sirii]|uniref:hypothetical protein n=1 Tax=Streptomyces sirii TaxID=3127701 RepID=UPI003D35E309